MVRLFYSRYHISTGQNVEDKFKFLKKGLSNQAVINYRKYSYKFIDIEDFKLSGSSYITGEIVKYNPEEIEKVIDEETDKIKNESIINKVKTKLRFIVDPSSSIIMHFIDNQNLQLNAFRTNFSKLFQENHDNFFVEMTISPIKEQYAFYEKIRTFKKVNKISITLFRSNPNFSDRWKSIDERLKKLNIDTYKEIQETKDKHNSIVIDDETENKFLMSDDGYGECSATGIDAKGNYKTINTRDNKKNVSSVLPENVNPDKAMDILKSVVETLQEIIKRTLK